MTDSRRRGHERGAAAGHNDAAAQVLRERIRLGEVTETAVRTTARLGYVPARLLFPDEPESKNLAGELCTPQTYHRDLVSAVCLAIARRVLAVCSAEVDLIGHEDGNDVRVLHSDPSRVFLQPLGDFVAHPSIDTAGLFLGSCGIDLDFSYDLSKGGERRSLHGHRAAAAATLCWLSLTEAPPAWGIRNEIDVMCRACSVFLARCGERVNVKLGIEQTDQLILDAAVEYLISAATRT